MKAIIVEDEFLAQQELSWMLQQHSEITIDACFDDVLDMLKYLQQHRVDVIFLDINIPSLDGMLLAQNIHQFAQRPLIVFITAWKEHAVEAFDYILKPYHEARIVTMLNKLEAAGQQQAVAHAPAIISPQTVNLVKDERIIVTDTTDIYYVEAHEKLTFVYTRREAYMMSMSISEFCARLPEQSFFRCHRSYFVNLSKIREIEP